MAVVGPVGVGKTAVSKALADKLGVPHVDFDRLRKACLAAAAQEAPNDDYDWAAGLGLITEVMIGLGVKVTSATFLDLPLALIPIVQKCQDLVLDIGGDTIFRQGVDNQDRLLHARLARDIFGFRFVLLTARPKVLFKRSVSSKKRKKEEFERDWGDWRQIQAPYWAKLKVEQEVDASFLAPEEVAEKVAASLLAPEPAAQG